MINWFVSKCYKLWCILYNALVNTHIVYSIEKVPDIFNSDNQNRLYILYFVCVCVWVMDTYTQTTYMILHSLLSYTITRYFVYVCVCVCVYRIYRACIAVCRQKVPYYSNLAADEHSVHARNGNGDTRIIIIYGSPFLWMGRCSYTLGTLSKLLSVLEKNRSPVYTFLHAIYVPRTSDGRGCTRCRKLVWYAYIRALLYIYAYP